MTERDAREAMTRLDIPYLRMVMQQGAWSQAILAAVALEHLTDDGRIDKDEAMELAAMALLLATLRREATRLAAVTGQAATAVSAIARFEAIRHAGTIIREVLPNVGMVLPPTGDALRRMLQGIQLRTSVLNGYGDDAVRMFGDLLDANMTAGQPLQTAARHAIDDLFAPGFDDMGLMTRRSVIVVRQTNYDTFRPTMTEMYRVNVQDVGWWEWRSRLDGNVCAACVALHGRVFPVSRAFEHAHIGCRCMPILSTSPKPSGKTGDEWLREHSPERQRAILGVRGAELFTEGAVTVQDFLKLKRHSVYGSTWQSGGIGYAERRAERRRARA